MILTAIQFTYVQNNPVSFIYSQNTYRLVFLMTKHVSKNAAKNAGGVLKTRFANHRRNMIKYRVNREENK